MIPKYKKLEIGFTLIEMLVTVSIASLLLAIAAPSFKAIVSQSNAMSTADDLSSSIRIARSEAIKRGERVTICANAKASGNQPSCGRERSWTNGWFVFVDNDEDGQRSNDESIITRMDKRPPALSMSFDSVFNGLLSFNPAGASVSVSGAPRSGIVIISYGDQGSRRLTLQANGRLSVDNIDDKLEGG